MPFSGLCEYQATRGAKTYMQTKHAHINKVLEIEEEKLEVSNWNFKAEVTKL